MRIHSRPQKLLRHGRLDLRGSQKNAGLLFPTWALLNAPLCLDGRLTNRRQMTVLSPASRDEFYRGEHASGAHFCKGLEYSLRKQLVGGVQQIREQLKSRGS